MSYAFKNLIFMPLSFIVLPLSVHTLYMLDWCNIYSEVSILCLLISGLSYIYFLLTRIRGICVALVTFSLCFNKMRAINRKFVFFFQLPFFPVVKKDLTFIHLGNDSYVDGLVNFEKFRLIARETRHICNMASAKYVSLSTNKGMIVFNKT